MLLAVHMISESKIDWANYLLLCKTALGRSVSQGVDKLKKPIGSLADFVCTLDELEHNWSDVITSLRECSHYLEHLSFTFLIVAEINLIYSLIRKSKLVITETATAKHPFHLAIISGNLAQWREAILNNSYSNDDNFLLQLMNRIVEEFDKKGLSQVFSGYQRNPTGNNTFLMLPRE